jgi:hypothetical protein
MDKIGGVIRTATFPIVMLEAVPPSEVVAVADFIMCREI